MPSLFDLMSAGNERALLPSCRLSPQTGAKGVDVRVGDELLGGRSSFSEEELEII